MAYDYDAFLCYNRIDSKIVEVIAHRLTHEGHLRVFLDKWNLIPGKPWQDEIERALDRSATCIVFVGSQGSSPWAHMEMRAALELRIDKRILRVIPTFLPGTDKKHEQGLPLFLKSFTGVDLRGWPDDKRAFEVLKAGIFGYEPDPPDSPNTKQNQVEHELGTMIVDSLLPVTDFQDRPELDVIRTFWCSDTHNGVMALIGLGGSGKTALVTRFLQELPNSSFGHRDIPKNNALPAAQGVFVWSFYNNPNIEFFIQALYEYLTGQEVVNHPARVLTYRLIRLMEGSKLRRVLLVLDGLEVVQEEQNSLGGFGLIRDASLRHLVRRIAQGNLGFRMLITSRFPFPDLLLFQGSGYWLVETDALRLSSARSLLRSRGVVGTDTDLNALIEDYGNHALTLDHLGTLLRDFFGGNVHRARELPPIGTAHGDAYAEYQASRLARIFSFYEKHLPDIELSILKVLCVYRRVPPLITNLIDVFVGRERNNTHLIPQLDEVTLRSVLARLHSRRLISFYGKGNRTTCVVHPSIRDYFYRALGKRSAGIHSTVREYLVPLAERPIRERNPLDPFALDVLEDYIYHSIKGGDVVHSLEQYEMQLGGYQHLAWRLSNYQRGLRISSLLVDSGGIELQNGRVCPWHDRSLFHLDLGHPDISESQMRELLAYYEDNIRNKRGRMNLSKLDKRFPAKEVDYYYKLDRHWPLKVEQWYFYYEATILQCICDALLTQGKLLEAERIAHLVINKVVKGSWEKHKSLSRESGSNPFGRRAIARFMLGKTSEALDDFQEADKLHNHLSDGRHSFQISFGGYHTALHVLVLTRLGKLRSAQKLLRKHNNKALRDFSPLLAAQYDLALAEVHLIASENTDATKHVDSALAWSIDSGHQETYVRANLAKARILLRYDNSDDSLSLLREAEKVARTSSYRIYLADVLVVTGHLALALGELDHAAELASEAFDISDDSLCGYKWGIGNAQHLMAEIEFERGNRIAATNQAKRALRIREAIQDPKQMNTQLLLNRINTVA